MEDGAEVAAADFGIVAAALIRYAQGFGLSRDDAEEVIGEVMSETLALLRARDRPRARLRDPTAYLFWITRNRARDRLRRIRTRGEIEFVGDDVDARYYSEEDEAVVRMLNRGATAAILEDAMRAAAVAGDRLVIRVVASWLNLAQESGAAPSGRQVAQRAQVSHTTVNAALRRLATYFPPDESDAVSS
jgi:DNA-directed RNA polymerase specialized sigma24 family protein